MDDEWPLNTIVQAGPSPLGHGGMASVIAEYLSLGFERFQMRNVVTWESNQRAVSGVSHVLVGLARIARQRSRVALVHVHLSERGSFIREGALIVGARMLGIKVIATLHGAELPQFAERHRLLTSSVLRVTDLVVCLGPKQVQLVNRLAQGKPTVIVRNPVDVPRVAPATATIIQRWEGKKILFSGEVGFRKGFDRLAGAWPEMSRKIADASLVVCGPLESGYEAVMPDTVEYMGVLLRGQLLKQLDSAAITVLPSRQEVLPMAILESLAAGVPVVATAVGETGSFKNCRSILWVDPDSADVTAKFAVAVTSILTSRSDYIELATEAHEWASKHVSKAVIVEQMQSVYGSVVSGHL